MINTPLGAGPEPGQNLAATQLFPSRDLSHDPRRRLAPDGHVKRQTRIATDDWMQEQQLRAEVEAEGWRRMRQKLARPEPAPIPAAVIAATAKSDPHRSGSTVLKALVRFMLAALAAYLAWIAGMDARLAEFDTWMATGSTFAIALALSMLSPARDFVHAAAETMRWILLIGLGFGATWFAFNWPS